MWEVASFHHHHPHWVNHPPLYLTTIRTYTLNDNPPLPRRCVTLKKFPLLQRGSVAPSTDLDLLWMGTHSCILTQINPLPEEKP